MGEEKRERGGERGGVEYERSRVRRLCNKLQQEELLRGGQGRRSKTLEGIGGRSGMGRCQTELGRESK